MKFVNYLRRLRLLLALGCAALLVSCATKSALRFEEIGAIEARSDFRSAISAIERQPKLYGKTNRFLYYMDLGVLFHYAGLYDSSTTCLLKAADIYDELYTRSVTNEAAAILTNDNVRPYRSKPYEIVFVHQLIQLNYLALDKLDDALVEARRTQLLFDQWGKKDPKEAGSAGGGMFHYLSSISYDGADRTDDAMISLFNAVRAYNDGPVSLPPPVGRYAAAMLLKNNRPDDLARLTLAADTADTGRFANGQSELIVVGYGGRGPVLQESVWWGTYVVDGLLVVHHTAADGKDETIALPAPPLLSPGDQGGGKGGKTKSGTTLHLKFSMPGLRMLPSETGGFTVRADSARAVQAAVINDLDNQAARYLEDTRGTTVARTALRVAIRTIAAQKAKAEMETRSPLANLLINVLSDVAADQLEHADTRVCFLVPRTIQLARVPLAPGRHQIEVTPHDRAGNPLGAQSYTIEIKPHEKKVLFCTSLR